MVVYDVAVSDISLPSSATSPWQRAAPLLGGVALAAAGTYVALNDPAAVGSRFPTCAFHSLTGLWCPGCGLTRGTHQLLNGNLPAALSYNIFTPLVLGAIVITWALWARRAWAGPTVSLSTSLPRWWGTALAATLVVYGVARNVPLPALRTLAP
jgi:hypothetical protein